MEILIAITIASIAFLGNATLITTLLNVNSLSRDRTHATILTQDKLEEIKNDAYANVIASNYPTEDYNTITGYPKYRREVTIAAGPLSNTKIVKVEVLWKDTNGIYHNTTTLTIIAQ